MSDPVSAAFESFVAELYWAESLEEAEEKLREFMEDMDEDLRELLLRRRREICRNTQLIVRTSLALQSIKPDIESLRRLPGDIGTKAAIVAALVNSLFLIQCAPSWSRMTPSEKASILAPLYRASYALRLAAQGKEDAPRLVDEALEMAAIALDRISRTGLLDEMEALASEG